MNQYFCDVNLQSKANTKRRLFIILDNDEKEGIPNLTKEILIENSQYRDFIATYKPKLIVVEYTVYKTDEDVFANTSDEDFIRYIDEQRVELIASSEMSLNPKEKIKSKKTTQKKKKKKSVFSKVITGVFALIIVAVGFIGGVGYSSSLAKNNTTTAAPTNESNGTLTEDGMIIPEQLSVNDENAQQITVSIDRSYSSVPKEDLQLKSSVVNGKAEITLPDFDRTDFFSHVPGYTWGFSSVPNATKIEFYAGQTYSFSKDTKLYRVLVKYGGGSGTREDPYIINYYDQLELMASEKARGYFKQTTDIEFPYWTNHESIDTINELNSNPENEIFEYDGNGYIISNLSAPLFGKVSGATIKNVHIRNSLISDMDYKNYGFIVCEAYNYQYNKNNQIYETGETIIENCTVAHCSINVEYPTSNQGNVQVVTAAPVVPPDVIEYDENGNVIEKPEQSVSGEYAIGGIIGLGGQIDNCYVTDLGIKANIDNHFSYVGGIAGKPANVTNSAVYFFSAQGNIFNAGGIVGSAGGARLYNAAGKEMPKFYGGNIQGCVARKIIITAESAVGGIAGSGSSNANTPMISNCYSNELSIIAGIYDSNGIMKKSGVTGGIIGNDSNDSYGHCIVNTVSPANYKAVGSAIRSKYDESIRLAPDYAFYQENIVSVINCNSVNPANPKEIFTGDFIFSTIFGDENGALPYPSRLNNLIAATITTEE